MIEHVRQWQCRFGLQASIERVCLFDGLQLDQGLRGRSAAGTGTRAGHGAHLGAAGQDAGILQRTAFVRRRGAVHDIDEHVTTEDFPRVAADAFLQHRTG